MATPQEDTIETLKARAGTLENSLAKANGELETAKSDALAAKGDADKAKAALEAAQKEIEQLKQANQVLSGQVAQTGLPPIPDLPKRAAQVTKGVVTHSGPADKDGRQPRLTVKAGEVVYVGTDKQVADLQEKLGSAVRVHRIDDACETDLRSMNALR